MQRTHQSESLAALLRERIHREGPLPFDQFMEAALYHPGLGYYRSGRNIFGRSGDFFTAEQLQPVFGEMLQQYVGVLSAGKTAYEIVELGAGHAELAAFLSPWRYTPVDLDTGPMPPSISGLVLAHEFFDALPVRLLQRDGRYSWLELRVALDAMGAFTFLPSPAPPQLREYAEEFGEAVPSEGRLEVNVSLSSWCERIAEALTSGYLLVFDYGYEPKELLRFPAGTLLSYRAHQAHANVLANPGEQDLTAHVNFAHLTKAAQSAGLRLVEKKTLAAWAHAIWSEEEFTARWQNASRSWRLLWKQIVFGMGESFHVLLFEKAQN